VSPHPIPLPDGGEGRVRGPLVKELNAFVLIILETGVLSRKNFIE